MVWAYQLLAPFNPSRYDNLHSLFFSPDILLYLGLELLADIVVTTAPKPLKKFTGISGSAYILGAFV